jgi:hypothetical protein
MTTPDQLAAIARSLKAHGSGRANVARLAKLFNVTEESITGAVARAGESNGSPAPTETAPAVNPVVLDRAQRFQREVIAAEAKPITSASTQDIENLIAAAMPR